MEDLKLMHSTSCKFIFVLSCCLEGKSNSTVIGFNKSGVIETIHKNNQIYKLLSFTAYMQLTRQMLGYSLIKLYMCLTSKQIFLNLVSTFKW